MLLDISEFKTEFIICDPVECLFLDFDLDAKRFSLSSSQFTPLKKISLFKDEIFDSFA
jgi:hypothetical protein